MKTMKRWICWMAVGPLLMGLLILPMVVLQRGAGAQQVKGGATLWAENCGRCHNVRSPRERSDRQWDIIIMHMRTRANLTGQEANKILEFLKQSN